MVINSPCLTNNKELTSPEQTAPALAILKQTTLGNEMSNPLMAGSLPKTIWDDLRLNLGSNGTKLVFWFGKQFLTPIHGFCINMDPREFSYV
ncbi:hypothetical protein Tco_0757144 [Tanacetum coccineum]